MKPRRKLRLNEKVEVRQLEKGLRGSWHPGVVVGVSGLHRSVKYDQLLCEEGDSHLVESIRVKKEIEGSQVRHLVSSTYRGRIRPSPLTSNVCEKLAFGVCVDVFFEDAWWEGIVFDCDSDADERLVFFPDEGDEQIFNVSSLRITRDWDEYLDVWSDRGVWVLAQLAKEFHGDVILSNFVKKIWVYLKSNKNVNKMTLEWTCSDQTLWSEYFTNAVRKITNASGQDVIKHDLATCRTAKDGNDKEECHLKTASSNAHASSFQARKLNTKKVESFEMSEHASSVDNTMDTASITTKDNQSKISNVGKNKCSTDRPDQKKIQGHGSSAQSSEGRMRNLRKSRQGKVHPAARFPNCSQKLRKKNTSLVIDGKQSEWKEASKQVQDIYSEPGPSSAVKESVQDVNGTIGYCLSMSSKNCVKHIGSEFPMPLPRKSKRKRGSFRFCPHDTICSFCRLGGDLIHCDNCPSSYHPTCLNLEAVPSKTWFCPFCYCCLCGSQSCKEQSGTCLQCCREYHLDCVSKAECGLSTDYPLEIFCSKACYTLCRQLHHLLGVPNLIHVSGLTWFLVRSAKNILSFPGVTKVDPHFKLSHVLKVLHECFEPVKDSYTKRDWVRDMIYNSRSKLKRLNFVGFHVMVLQKDKEIVSVATIRFHGLKAAEMPLVATPFKYRGQGMCRLLMNELLKLLVQLGIERLIIPAIPELVKTWGDSFGFQEMSHSERLQFLGYPLLAFQGTTMLQKFLGSSYQTSEKDDGLTSQNSEDISSNLSMDDTKSEHRSQKGPSGLLSAEAKRNTGNVGKENRVSVCNRKMHTYRHLYKQRRLLVSQA